MYLPVPDAFSPALQQLNETLQPNETCQTVLDQVAMGASAGAIAESPFRFNLSLACATPVNTGSGICFGDSGPLFTTNNVGKPLLVGFATDYLSLSYESPCANGVDIYTRIAPYLQWISSRGHNCDGSVEDLSSRVGISQSGFAFNRGLGLWASTLTVQNRSVQAISGPVRIVLTQLPATVTMANNAGKRNSDPYITVLSPGQTLAPGAMISTGIQFSNTNNVFINFIGAPIAGCAE